MYHSDASYLSVSTACSRTTEIFYLYSISDNPPLNNGIRALCTVLKFLMVAAAGFETGVLFLDFQESFTLRQSFEEMGNP